MDQGRKNLEEMFQAMESPEKWKEFKRAQNKVFTKQIDEAKAAAFSDYLTKHFIAACNDKTVAGRFMNWDTVSDDNKVDIARDIVNLFMKKIKEDIFNNRVTIYTRSGEEYKKTNENVDAQFRQDVASGIKEIKVSKNTKMNAFMATNNIGDIAINTNCIFYKDTNNAILFLMDLRHELTHVIDVMVPNISPLEPDVREMSLIYYDGEDAELYTNNPLELSANTHRKEYRIKIQEMLEHQEQMLSNTNQKQDSR